MTGDDEETDSIDTGEPVTELETLLEPPTTGFLSRLRNKIERRTLASNVVGMAWTATNNVVIEFIKLVFELLGPRDRGDRK